MKDVRESLRVLHKEKLLINLQKTSKWGGLSLSSFACRRKKLRNIILQILSFRQHFPCFNLMFQIKLFLLYQVWCLSFCKKAKLIFLRKNRNTPKMFIFTKKWRLFKEGVKFLFCFRKKSPLGLAYKVAINLGRDENGFKLHLILLSPSFLWLRLVIYFSYFLQAYLFHSIG